MAHDVEYTDEFGAWFEALDDSDQNAVAKKVDLLEMTGPSLGRPHVDSVEGSRHSNMKELRMSRRAMRVLFAFDRRRSAILLIGGSKEGDGRFYETMIPQADDLFDIHLLETQQDTTE